MKPPPSTPIQHAPPLWPMMLRATGLGLRPERMIVAFIAALLVAGLVRVPIPWESGSLLSTWRDAANRSNPQPWSWDADARLREQAAWLDFAAGFFSTHVWSVLAVGTPIAAVLIVASAMIARMAAMEFGLGSILTIRNAAGLAVARLPSLAAAFGIPILLATLVLVVFAAAGALLLAFPWLNLAGALVYGVAVLGSLLLTVLLAAFALGSPLLAPAVVCEGTGTGEHGRGDAIDALQRVLAYLLNAPLRLTLFGLIGLAQVAVVSWIGVVVASVAVRIARGACTLWLSQDRAASLSIGGEGSAGIASSIMAFWEWVPFVLASACSLSVFASASSLLYLLLRRVCDGQHQHEIWTPTALPTAAESNPGEAPGGDDEDE